MKDLVETEEKARRAFLVTVRDEKMSKGEADSLAKELAGLVTTLALEIAAQETVHVREYNARYVMGTGKAEELAEKAASIKADCIIFGRDISPSQQRNWEELSDISVIDRQELIIQIFASRARTREAELQVTLAELNYALPRLQHKYIDLSRQRGGHYGTRGSGESRLETDRRLVEQRIQRLETELEEVKRQRQVQRRQRERQGVPVCALVGYTNAGKSSILNALTGAGVLAEDKLFATLDPTSRRLELPLGLQVLMVDTVGFIRRLPHNLINAFRSTLEEASHADMIVNILDASDGESAEQYKTTLAVLGELDAAHIPMITALNKIDRLDDSTVQALLKLYPESVPVSATEGKGLGELCARIEQTLSGGRRHFRFPPERADLAALVHRSGQVISEKYGEQFIEMEARVDERTAGRLKEYQVNG
ncbi:MAG: GTPase HflX [Treponema sp.]|nr:GTPase HflX [Treponema sp.]